MSPTLFSCGSNAASHLALSHPDDVSVLIPTLYHPSLPAFPNGTEILDVVSASAHSLVLLRLPPSSPSENEEGGMRGKVEQRHVLLGCGTNTFGQLGPKCALWDDLKPEGRWKVVDLARDAGLGQEWEPVRIAATWTTSFVVYRQTTSGGEGGGAEGGGGSSAASGANKDDEDVVEGKQVVISCGSNDFGELGRDLPLTLSNTPTPIPISQASQVPTIIDLSLRPGERVEFLKGGQRHVVAVVSGKAGQRVVGWGASRKGELSADTLSSNTSKVLSSKAKGKSKAAPYPTTSPPTIIHLPVPSDQRIINISLGASHSLALLSGGTVLGWGGNLKGQITDVHLVKGVKEIASTWGGSYFLTDEGLFSQGSNTHSQLLRGQSVGSELGQVAVPEALKVDRIVAGTEHLLFIATTSDGSQRLLSGGWNEHGNLALGDQLDRDSLKVVPGWEGRRTRGVWGGCASSWAWA
ncbi:hypothetical protein L198_02128 [Cryptococcus wingfieldii CBS 7118]|uniref:Secretion-regulating guanine nucleotide exchange factor n=1 Tax=Cryptococcus wingfieldii CBS 7118 TaxID=1295528 RepID=A0A1E3JX65_9TREE|nr:hypothetical protein L198_02128 [Cryptococcus wingfieldii CBS 7118]ODO05435.1 hypothetical protein L198_02128 [Cryptococcus wingfieldii CBS 7118]